MSTGADTPAVSGDVRVYVNVSNPLLRPYRTGSYLIYDQGGTDHFRCAMDLKPHSYPASGSHQLDEREFLDVLAVNVVTRHKPKRIYLVDLREETHGFLDGIAVSWYADNDFANVGQSWTWIQTDERLRLQLLQGETPQLFSLDMHPADNRCQQRVAPMSYTELKVGKAATEEKVAEWLAGELGVPVTYRRIPVTDHCAPSTRALAELRRLWREASEQQGSWVHFHCHGGDGRTTTFLALWDMLSWKRTGQPLPPLSEFACRQCQLFNYCINPAGCGCGKCEEDEAAVDSDWKLPLAQARWQMLEEFRQELVAGARTG
jgi:Inositol hexakisphosphate